MVPGNDKIVTDPLPLFFALGYGIPLGLIFSAGFLIWDKLRHRVPNALNAIVFAAVMISIEWIQHRFTPLARGARQLIPNLKT